jgi:hypothetical protein
VDELLILLGGHPELDPNVVLTGFLTLVGVGITALAAYLASRARKTPPVEHPAVTVPPSPLANFSGTQNEFMALVIKDNEAIRAELAGVRDDVARLGAELAEARSAYGLFERAVRRYLELVASVWPGPEPMPWPDSDDFGLLERILPRRRHIPPRL